MAADDVELLLDFDRLGEQIASCLASYWLEELELDRDRALELVLIAARAGLSVDQAAHAYSQRVAFGRSAYAALEAHFEQLKDGET